MSAISVPATIQDAPAASQPLLEAVNKQLGVVPNLFRMISNSPSALAGYLELSGNLSKGLLPAAVREAIALAIAELNQCSYCLSAHSYLAANLVKVSEAEIQANRRGLSSNAKTQAILDFATAVALDRGRVAESSLNKVKAAGVTDAEIVEIILHVALNIFTNYLNNAGKTAVDFPVVNPL